MRTLRLRTLLDGFECNDIGAATDPEIRAVTIDSRKATPGILFVACPGVTTTSKDGHDFIPQALAQGASGLVVESVEKVQALGVDISQFPCFVVENARQMVAALAEKISGSPSSTLRVLGVTGTNGKSTVTFLLASALQEMGRRAAVFGTLGAGDFRAPRAFGFTTPEAEVLSLELDRLRTEGFVDVAMEVSSHALATARVDGVAFSVAAFTNLSQDHLDFHADMRDYFEAKAKLFDAHAAAQMPKVLPASSDVWATELRARHPDALTWGTEQSAQVQAVAVNSSSDGLRFTIRYEGQSAKVESPLLGAINLENLLCAGAILLALGHELDAVASGLSAAETAPGRLQRVAGASPQQPLVVVDYAHTPDALARALSTVRSLQDGKVAVVFGCGGERDKGKRPLMAKAAEELADLVVLTNDNPRHEDPDSILDDIEAGIHRLKVAPLENLQVGQYAREPDRRAAIAGTLKLLGPSDVLLIAGKGHERTQSVGEETFPFDDVEVASSLLGGAA